MKKAILAGVCASLVATAIGIAARDDGHAVAQPRASAASASAPAPAALPSSDVIADVAERVVPSVVNVATAQRHDVHAGGSGVIVSADGKILTNAHVVRDAAEIHVTLHDGSEVEARLVGIDSPSDLAVLQLAGSPSGLTPLPFADSTRTRLGEVVLAVGNPFGVGQAVTMGIVSATSRASMGIVEYEDFIQTDAAINPGNSGGALVNLRGELVGINTAILSRTGGNQGIGFAIPTALARPIMDMLIKDGKVSRGYLGVGLGKASGGQGVLIESVEDQTPAEQAGLSVGDVITAVDGTAVRDISKLRMLVAMKGANKPATLDILRDGKRRAVKVTLGEQPSPQQRRRVPLRRPAAP